MVTIKKPIWSTEIVGLDGKGVVIHNYADGTNSGPINIDRSGGIYPFFSKHEIRFNSDETDFIAEIWRRHYEDLG